MGTIVVRLGMFILVAGACSSFGHSGGGSRALSAATAPSSVTTSSTVSTTMPCADRTDGSSLDVEGDFDGDGRLDRAYQRHTGAPSYEGFLVVCLADGRSDEIEIGQAEGAFYAADLDRDGRSEIMYGGTSVSQALEVLAVIVDGRLMTEAGDGPALATGPTGPDWENIGQGWGCDDTDRDGRREVVQVTVHRKGSRASWTKEIYRVQGARLILLRTTTGSVRAADDPTQQAEALVPNC